MPIQAFTTYSFNIYKHKINGDKDPKLVDFVFTLLKILIRMSLICNRNNKFRHRLMHSPKKSLF